MLKYLHKSGKHCNVSEVSHWCFPSNTNDACSVCYLPSFYFRREKKIREVVQNHSKIGHLISAPSNYFPRKYVKIGMPRILISWDHAQFGEKRSTAVSKMFSSNLAVAVRATKISIQVLRSTTIPRWVNTWRQQTVSGKKINLGNIYKAF